MIAACGQLEAKSLSDASAVWPVAERIAEQAGEAGVDLLVLPEVMYPSYWLESEDAYRQAAIDHSEAVLARLSRMASRHACWLVAGFVEEEEDHLFNSAAVFDRAGKLVGITRKQFMWDCDQRWFEAGLKSRVFETEFGMMGVQICADARLPEITATLVNAGAQFIVLPTAWVNASKVRRMYRNIQADFLIRARAAECSVPFICSSKSGHDSDKIEYVGQSQIVSADGRVLAQAALGGDELITAEVSPADQPRKPIMTDDQRRRLLSQASSPATAESATTRCELVLDKPIGEVMESLDASGARAVRLSLDELGIFAPARCHALDGTQVLVVDGKVYDDAMMRARAAENRVFTVVVAGDKAQYVVDPEGTIIWRDVDWQTRLELDLEKADVKAFLPTTNIWSQRRVETYTL